MLKGKVPKQAKLLAVSQNAPTFASQLLSKERLNKGLAHGEME